MKTRFSLLLALFIASCSQNKVERDEVQFSKKLITYEDFTLNKDFLNLIDSLIGVYDKNERLAFQCYILNDISDTTTIVLKYSYLREAIKRSTPIGFFHIDSALVLVYSGINNLIINDSTFQKRLDKELNGLEFCDDFTPRLYILGRRYYYKIRIVKTKNFFIERYTDNDFPHEYKSTDSIRYKPPVIIPDL